MSDLWARTTELVPVLPSSASSSVAAASAVAATAHNDDDYFYDYGEEDSDFYELGEEEEPPSSFDRFPPSTSITTSRGGNYSRLAFDVGLWSVCPVAEGGNSKTGRMEWSGMVEFFFAPGGNSKL